MTPRDCAIFALISSTLGMYLSHKLDSNVQFYINVAVFVAATVLLGIAP